MAIISGILLITFEEFEPLFSIGLIIYFTALFIWLLRQLIVLFRLKKERTHMELVHLQSQVNPHFFFNTLNNLYGLMEKDVKKAQTMVLMLSEMMRYSIYQGQKSLVTLEEEVTYLKNYMELHKMRYHKHIDLSFTVELWQPTGNVMPLLFIILLENAFKHGVEKLTHDAYVRASLVEDTEYVHFTIENNLDPEEDTHSPGIGLANLKRRLELAYPNAHTLTFQATDDVYKAQLSLKLR